MVKIELFQWLFKSKREDKWFNKQRELKRFYIPEDNGECRTIIANTPHWLKEFFAFQEREKTRDIREQIEDFIRKEYPGDEYLKSGIYEILK